MNFNGKLVLEDGSEFFGNLFGEGEGEISEIVFNTSMVGYQEILSDPSYCDQIVCMTYPLIGNYGLNKRFFESEQIACKGFIVREVCKDPSHFENQFTLESFFKEKKLLGLTDVDTRALTKKLREHGTIKGVIANINDDSEVLIQKIKEKELKGQVKKVSCQNEKTYNETGDKHVVLYDFGAKRNILMSLLSLNYKVTVVPYNTSCSRVEELTPNGVCLSNGPGNPEELSEVIDEVKKLQEKFPIFGICLGHQLLCLANGAATEKMLFGHRGGNHPVKDIETERVYMSSQNHGYVVKEKSLPEELSVTFINVNDKTVEGVKHKKYPAFSVQFHPEFRPGPRDTNYLFKRFDHIMEATNGQL